MIGNGWIALIAGNGYKQLFYLKSRIVCDI